MKLISSLLLVPNWWKRLKHRIIYYWIRVLKIQEEFWFLWNGKIKLWKWWLCFAWHIHKKKVEISRYLNLKHNSLVLNRPILCHRSYSLQTQYLAHQMTHQNRTHPIPYEKSVLSSTKNSFLLLPIANSIDPNFFEMV